MTLAANSLEQVVELMDQAFNEGDLETLLNFYEDAAVVVPEPSRTISGKVELRAFFETAMQSGMAAKQLRIRVLEVDGIALFLSRWALTSREAKAGAEPRTFTATTVFRKQADGSWRALIDNPLGPLILEAEA